MNEPILSRAAIAEDAKTAAERAVSTGCVQPNPHVPGTDAWSLWRSVHERWLLALSAPEGTEGGC